MNKMTTARCPFLDVRELARRGFLGSCPAPASPWAASGARAPRPRPRGKCRGPDRARRPRRGRHAPPGLDALPATAGGAPGGSAPAAPGAVPSSTAPGPLPVPPLRGPGLRQPEGARERPRHGTRARDSRPPRGRSAPPGRAAPAAPRDAPEHLPAPAEGLRHGQAPDAARPPRRSRRRRGGVTAPRTPAHALRPPR